MLWQLKRSKNRGEEMKSGYITKKNFDDLDLNFILERLQLASPYGEMAKRLIRPFYREDQAQLIATYDRLEAALEMFGRNRSDVLELKALLKDIKQLDTTFERIQENEPLSITELFEIKQMAMQMEKILNKQNDLYWEKIIGEFKLFSAQAIIQLLDPENSGVSTFYIYSTYSEKLTTIRNKIENIDRQAKAELKAAIDALTSEGFPVGNNGDLRISVRDQDLMKRVKTDSRFVYRSDVPMYSVFSIRQEDRWLREKEQLLLEEEDEELEVRVQLTESLKSLLQILQTNTEHIGQMDLLIAKTQFSVAFSCVRPILRDDKEFHINEGRHLKVSHSLEKAGKKFTPINVSLKKSVTLITGANMGGKTVSLKLIGQIVAMAQFGFFVPCQKAELPIFDFIFISVGDFQSIDMGLSTFGGEIVEIEQAIKREGEFGLILIDELARGTNPLEGYAISRALIEHLKSLNSRAVITTHFDGLTNVSDTAHYQVNGLSNINLDLIRDKIETQGVKLLHEYMDYRLSEVSQLKEIPKEAIRISELMGLDKRIINRAKEILGGSHGE